MAKSYDQVIKQFLLKHIKPGSRVLDVGCGDGSLDLYLAKTISDVQIDGVEVADIKSHAANTRFVLSKRDHHVLAHRCQCKELATRFAKASFDVCLAIHSFHHFEKPSKCLRSIKAMLKLGGVLLLCELTSEYGETVDDCPRYSLKKITQLIKKSGLSLQSATKKLPGVILIRATKE